MKFLLPMALIFVGLRIFTVPIFKSLKFGVEFDLTGYNHLIGATLFFVGALLFWEALQSTKRS